MKQSGLYCVLGDELVHFSLTGRCEKRLPLGSVYIAVAVVCDPSGRVFLTGGIVEGLPSKHISEYQEGTLTAIGQLLKPRSSHSSCWHAGSIYSVGGYAPIEAFDLTSRVSAKIDLEERQSGAVCACVHNGDLVIFGKRNENGKQIIGMTFSIARKEWGEIQLPRDFPKNLKLAVCFALDKRSVVLFGGTRDPSISNTDTFVYDALEKCVNRINYKFEPETYRPPVVLHQNWLHAVDEVGRRHTLYLKPLLWELKSEIYGAVHWKRRRLALWCCHNICKLAIGPLGRLRMHLLLEVISML